MIYVRFIKKVVIFLYVSNNELENIMEDRILFIVAIKPY